MDYFANFLQFASRTGLLSGRARRLILAKRGLTQATEQPNGQGSAEA
jgi:hypothetical protein